MGYVSTEVGDIRLSPRGGTEQDLGTLRLEPNIQALEAAEVVEQRSSLEMMIDRKVFRVGDDLNSAGSTATELLRNVPSIDVDIDGNLSLRGSGNVTILIDGRPSGMTGSATQSLLEQIPASSIDRVEIITSPTAKYDPEGVAGILNIILKKDKLEGKKWPGQRHMGNRREPQRLLQRQHPRSETQLFAECGLEPTDWIPPWRQRARTSLWW